MKICIVLGSVFFITLTFFISKNDLNVDLYQRRWQHFFDKIAGTNWSSNHLYSKYNSSSQYLPIKYEAHERLDLNPKTVYDSVIEKFMSPWLKSASNISGKPIRTNQEFPLFSTAHYLELQLLDEGYFNYFRITRYRKNVTDDGKIQWIKHPDKPILQSVIMPCSSLASHGLTPPFLKPNTSSFVSYHLFRRILQYVIDVSPNSDLPDHVNIYIPTHNYPVSHKNREYRSPKLRQLLKTMQETSIVPPRFAFCSKVDRLGIPFLYFDQLLSKPIENLVEKLMIFHKRNDTNFAVTLPEFMKRNNTILWRGSTSGHGYTIKNWLTGQRSQLVQLSVMAPDLLDARFTSCVSCTPDVLALMNITFGRWMNAPFVSSDTYFRTKFLIDIEGDGRSSNFYELMLTGATIFKVYRTDKCDEFWYDLLTPDVDFVPISADFSDLFSKLIYYREHPEEALEIANNGLRRVRFLLRRDIWPRYVTGMFRAIAALQTKPDSSEEQQIASLGLSLDTCSSVPLDHCRCKPL